MNSGITGSLTIPGSVNEIASSAFAFCNGLNSAITLEEGVTTVNGYVFYKCPNIAGPVTLPRSLTFMGAGAFDALDITMRVPTDSYAAQWAAAQGFTTETY